TARSVAVCRALGRTQATRSRSDRVIVPRDFSKEETAAKAAPVPPEQPAGRRRSKRERCSRDTSVVRCPRNLLSRDPFGRVELLLPPRKAMIRIKRGQFLRGRSVREALPDSCQTSRVSR